MSLSFFFSINMNLFNVIESNNLRNNSMTQLYFVAIIIRMKKGNYSDYFSPIILPLYSTLATASLNVKVIMLAILKVSEITCKLKLHVTRRERFSL